MKFYGALSCLKQQQRSALGRRGGVVGCQGSEREAERVGEIERASARQKTKNTSRRTVAVKKVVLRNVS